MRNQSGSPWLATLLSRLSIKTEKSLNQNRWKSLTKCMLFTKESEPGFVVTEAEVLSEVCFKNFEIFPNVVYAMDLYSLFTVDAVATCCYGIELQREAGTKSVKSLASRYEFVQVSLTSLWLNVLRVIIGGEPSCWFNNGISPSRSKEFERYIAV